MKIWTTYLLAMSIFLLWGSSILKAQRAEHIRTGRPGHAFGAFTVGKNYIQFQQGIGIEAQEIGHILMRNEFSSNNVIRYGISENFELSGLASLGQVQDRLAQSGEFKLLALQLGFRLHLCDQKGFIPAISYQNRFILPKNGVEMQIPAIGNSSQFSTHHAIGKHFAFNTNLGLVWNGISAQAIGKYVANVNWTPLPKTRVIAECYGNILSSNSTSNIGLGFAYRLNSNVQLDLSGNYGGNFIQKIKAINGGISWRLDLNQS